MLSLTITLLFAAIFAGFVASVPVGPVNLWIAHKLLQNRYAPVIFFVFGVIVIDLLYVSAGFVAYFFVAESINIGKFWHILGGLLMTGIGLMSLVKNRKKIKEDTSYPAPQYQKLRFFLIGILLCASNVALSVLWFFIAGLFDYYQLAISNTSHLITVIVGVAIGDLIWFYAYIFGLKKGSRLLPTLSTSRLQTLIALALIVFGLFTACRQL